jgi:hypothetical protein
MFKADNSTVILFLGGKKHNVAEHRINCAFYQYEQDDSTINKSNPSFRQIPHVILCFKDFISHEASHVFKEKAIQLGIHFVIASGGLGSLVEQARLQGIDLSNVIITKPKTGANVTAASNGNGGTCNLVVQPQAQSSVPKHYNAEFRDSVAPGAKQIKINNTMAVHVFPNKIGSYSLLLRGSWLDEADRLATKYGIDGNSEIPLKRFVNKNVALKIYTDFSKIMASSSGSGIRFDYRTIQKALNTYRNAECPDQFKKSKRQSGPKSYARFPMKPKPTKPTSIPAPAPTPAPAPAPIPILTPEPASTDNLPSSVMSALIDNPSGADKMETSVDKQIDDLGVILREIRGRIQKRRSLTGNNSIEIFLTEMVLHYRDEDETKRELIQLFKEFANLRGDYAKLKGEYDLLAEQWSNCTDQLKVKLKELDAAKEEIKTWKALASRSN